MTARVGVEQEPEEVVSRQVFWLPGVHKVEARARQIGHPETIDPERGDRAADRHGDPLPVTRNSPANFHGQAGASGCSCETSSSSSGALFALVLGLVTLPTRGCAGGRARSHVARIRRSAAPGPAVWLVASRVAGCSCGNPCGSKECAPGEVEMGAIGRFTTSRATTSA